MYREGNVARLETFKFKIEKNILDEISMLTTIGERIKYYRIKNGMYQDELSKVSGVSRDAISKFETNELNPTIQSANKLARAFDVSDDTFYDDYMKFITNNYGEQIKEIRLKLNLTQKEFGQAIGVSKNCVKWWENEKTVPLRKSFNEIKKIIYH